MPEAHACGHDRFRVRGVSVTYPGVRALHDVSFDVEPGEAIGFVGPSGAGKTTLLRVLNGTLRPTTGTVEVGGEVLATLSNRELRRVRACVGFVHQELDLVPNLRVIQNVVSGRLGNLGLLASLRAMLLPRRADAWRAHEILERVGIPEKLYERTDRLSGGQQQRVAIARALFQDPATLLADEPVSSVDPARARDAVALLTAISREEALTLCVSLHALDLAREFFPRLIGMRDGRIVFDRPADAVEEAEFTALYHLGNSNGA